MTDQADFGVVGLGVMGASLALNMEEKGSRVALMDLDPEKAKAMVQEAGEGAKLVPAEDTRGFVAALRVPRRILIMVPAGKPVEASLESLAPHLDPGDVVIDGGNEFYTETERRQKRWLASGIHLIGMGVSGGQEGARRGPSMMPGGDEGAYREVEPVLQSIAAQVEDGACVTYIGQGGSGHFVKMVHNGIEYADMQLIAEVYDLLRNAGGVSADNLADTFGAWNQGPLESFLVEITADILRKADDADPSRPLVDAILDSAKMKGTGSWTVKEGAELASPMPTIGSAVEARLMSGLKGLRGRTSQVLVGPSPGDAPPADGKTWIDDARDALYAAKICAYAQGMGVLQAAAEERGWALDLAEISRIWKAGCIIRARLLADLQRVYKEEPAIENLLLGGFGPVLAEREAGWRRTLARCVEHGIPAPALFSARAYYDGLRRARLPANLTQAQRDYFGAHRYQRLDREGTFHTDW